MKSLPIDRPTLDDPVYSQRNPHQTFLLVFSVWASIPLLTTGQSSSRVLDQQLSSAVVLVWGCALLFGSALALLGEFWPGHTWTGLVLERSGILIVGVGAGIYAAILWATTDRQADVQYVVGVTGAYSCSCYWRVWQITRRLRWIRNLIAEVNRG